MQKELREKLGYPPAEEAGSRHSSVPPQPPLQQAADCLVGLEGNGGVSLTVGVTVGVGTTQNAAQLTNNGQGGERNPPDAIEQAAADADLWPIAASVHPTMYSLLPPPDDASATAGNAPETGAHQSCLNWNERAGWITGALHTF